MGQVVNPAGKAPGKAQARPRAPPVRSCAERSRSPTTRTASPHPPRTRVAQLSGRLQHGQALGPLGVNVHESCALHQRLAQLGQAEGRGHGGVGLLLRRADCTVVGWVVLSGVEGNLEGRSRGKCGHGGAAGRRHNCAGAGATNLQALEGLGCRQFQRALRTRPNEFKCLVRELGSQAG